MIRDPSGQDRAGARRVVDGLGRQPDLDAQDPGRPQVPLRRPVHAPRRSSTNFNIFRDPKVGQNAIFWPPMTITAGRGNTVVIKLAEARRGAPGDARDRVLDDREPRRRARSSAPSTAPPARTAPARSRWPTFTPGQQVRREARGAATRARTSRSCRTTARRTSTRSSGCRSSSRPSRANEIESRARSTRSRTRRRRTSSRLKGNSDLVVLDWPALANSFMSPNWTMHRSRLRRHPRPPGDVARDRPRRHRQGRVLRQRGRRPTGRSRRTTSTTTPPSSSTTSSIPNLATKLLDQAGWVKGSGGVREKDGKKLSFTHLDWAAQSQGKLIMEAIVPMLQDVGDRR